MIWRDGVPDNVGIVMESYIILFGLINALDLSFPDNLTYTFEFYQKVN